ncbi:Outer membrane usher protein fimD precursor [Serratia fonticola]|uniref:Outer membrane usher protein fimD n=1 Tax=Serratia fonticola TaxID=47917 RepID=A0A4U9UUX2_SERFO|nr:Outer membrane usher protein fimD precursor [Serratia fonticola]
MKAATNGAPSTRICNVTLLLCVANSHWVTVPLPAKCLTACRFRGGQLASDEEMLPDSMKGYSPVVRGIAKSNAQVTVRQNGYVIYQSYVSPGAFEINDLYSTSGSGDLAVTVTEADGSEQNFIVPFASVPVLQREGALKYSLTGRHYRSSDNSVG